MIGSLKLSYESSKSKVISRNLYGDYVIFDSPSKCLYRLIAFVSLYSLEHFNENAETCLLLMDT